MDVHTIRNEARGEEYDRKGHIYSMPVVHLALSDRLTREQHIVLGKNHFLDVFVREADQGAGPNSFQDLF